jgi:hypothetical protein
LPFLLKRCLLYGSWIRRIFRLEKSRSHPLGSAALNKRIVGP